ncbi:MAG TPA: WxcM-like domain-containing protein [Terriglobales bacterium]|jgi:dTDP-4-dehydrorhamnose 3,5-epimerase|nr:WxcM-like domain-containing protein [Terriglobales bacterium]
MEGLRVDVLDVKKDERGWLAEIMRSGTLKDGLRMSQLFVTVGNPGKTKGKHFHRRKTEWFSVVSGDARLYLHDTRTGEKTEVPLGEKNMVTVTIPPHVAHAITSNGDMPFYLIVVASEDFNPDDADTFPYDFPEL